MDFPNRQYVKLGGDASRVVSYHTFLLASITRRKWNQSERTYKGMQKSHTGTVEPPDGA